MKVILLAGGLGTRLQEETVARPKPMVEIGGRPILRHIMPLYAAHWFGELVVALGYKAAVVRSYFLHYHYLGRDSSINLADGATTIRGRGSEDWSVHPAYAGVNLGELVQFHDKHGKLATVTDAGLERTGACHRDFLAHAS